MAEPRVCAVIAVRALAEERRLDGQTAIKIAIIYYLALCNLVILRLFRTRRCEERARQLKRSLKIFFFFFYFFTRLFL